MGAGARLSVSGCIRVSPAVYGRFFPISSPESCPGASLRVASQTRWSASASPPWTHFAYTFSRTATRWRAHSPTWAASLVVRNQVETAACRRLYGTSISGEAASSGGKPMLLLHGIRGGRCGRSARRHEYQRRAGPRGRRARTPQGVPSGVLRGRGGQVLAECPPGARCLSGPCSRGFALSVRRLPDLGAEPVRRISPQ